jgi:hypothetical protein
VSVLALLVTGARLTKSFDFFKREVGRRARLLGKGALRLLPNGLWLGEEAETDANLEHEC